LSILTKICVVLVLVVSVAASGAFLRIVSVPKSWKQSYMEQEKKAAVADLTAANALIALQQAKAKTETAESAIVTLKKSLTDAQNANTADKAAAAAEAGIVQGNYDSLKASLTELQKALESSLAMKAQLLKENTALAASVETANATARGLKKDLDEASVLIRRLESMGRHYALLIKDLQAEKAELQMQLENVGTATAAKGGGATAAPIAGPGQAVSGKITAVSQGVASINIGRAKGISEKMVLKIYRAGKFVAHLRIDLVEPDSSAGVILDKKLDVLQGDNVATDLR
jgi:hypothetical protein